MSRLPWQRQDYDCDQSWPVFVAYRDQRPPRRGVSISLDGRRVDPYLVSQWLRRNFWMERCAEYDAHMDYILLAEREKILAQSEQDVSAEYRAFTAAARELLLIEMDKLTSKSKEGGFAALTVRELIRLGDVTMKIDQLTRGKPTAIEQSADVDLTHVSDSDLAEARKRLGLG